MRMMTFTFQACTADNDDAEDDEDAEDDDDDAKTMMTRIWAVAAASGNSHRAGPTD